MLGHLGPFGKDHTVKIDNLHASMPQASHGFLQKICAVTVLVFLSIVGEKSSDVFLNDRTKNGVCNGMQKNIGIAVTYAVKFTVNNDPTDSQWTPGAEPMSIVSKAIRIGVIVPVME